jgi:hypothetical protein
MRVRAEPTTQPTHTLDASVREDGLDEALRGVVGEALALRDSCLAQNVADGDGQGRES